VLSSKLARARSNRRWRPDASPLAMSKDAFPLLKNVEVLQCLNELGIQSTEDDLTNPTAVKVQHIYASFNELLLHRKREDMAQPDFEGLQQLEFPELHEQSVPMIGYITAW
jgi:kinetochore protein Nuf2